MHACIVCMHACVHACMHCMCVCMHAYIHAHTHTHTQTQAPVQRAHAPACSHTEHAAPALACLCTHRPRACTAQAWTGRSRTGINWPHIARVPTLNRSTAQACSGRPRVYSPHTGRSRTGRARDGSRAAPRGRGSGSGVWQHVYVGQAPAYADACVRRACRGVCAHHPAARCFAPAAARSRQGECARAPAASPRGWPTNGQQVFCFSPFSF